MVSDIQNKEHTNIVKVATLVERIVLGREL